jgi:ADP-glucose pyrophosphorylase
LRPSGRPAGRRDRLRRPCAAALLDSGQRLFAYDFATNVIPGIKPHEKKVYWRDVGTIDAYFNAHKDVLGAEPAFDAFNPDWPIYSSNYQGPVARVLGARIDNALLGAATVDHENARLIATPSSAARPSSRGRRARGLHRHGLRARPG